MRTRVEVWGAKPGGRSGKAPRELGDAVDELIREYGAEAVAQVAVIHSNVEPFTPAGATE